MLLARAEWPDVLLQIGIEHESARNTWIWPILRFGVEYLCQLDWFAPEKARGHTHVRRIKKDMAPSKCGVLMTNLWEERCQLPSTRSRGLGPHASVDPFSSGR